MRIKPVIFFAVGCLVFAGLAAGSQNTRRTGLSQSPESRSANFYTWGTDNTPAWVHKLHISGYRIGCSASVAVCVSEARDAANQPGARRITLAIPLDPAREPADALKYSQASLSNPFLAEVTFDDFVRLYGRLFARPGFSPPSWLAKVLHNAKAKNPSLRVGITLYENELDSAEIRPPKLPSKVAAGINDVYLYLHYRANAPNYPSYVRRTKALFPNAKVIAGSYAYDRVNYLPCAPSSHRYCTPAQDIRLYKESIAIQARLLKEGVLAGIEFYPGYFGKESEWPAWKKGGRICHPDRVHQCIDDTRTMREDAAKVLGKALGW